MRERFRRIMVDGVALIDGHVHLHGCYDLDDALDAAVENLETARADLDFPAETPLILWLVETGERGAERLLERARGRWTVVESGGVSLRLNRSSDGSRMTAVRGSQVRTAEDLEVLVVGTQEPVAGNLPLPDTIEACMDLGALVMLPWGFGKWTGSRARAIVSAFERYSPRGLRLADTGARTRLLAISPVLARSIAAGLPVFAGSDPFPFADQVSKIGRHGFVLEGVGSGAGWEDLHPIIRTVEGQPRRFGRPLGAIEFARLQGKMQLRKRFSGGRTP
jgi:hypothetical protein